VVTWDVSSFLGEAGLGQGEPLDHGWALPVRFAALLSAKSSPPSGEGEKMPDENQTQLGQGFAATPVSNQQRRTTSFLLANPMHVNPTPILGCYQLLSKKPALLPLGLSIPSCFLSPLPTHAPPNGPAQPLPRLTASNAPSTVLQFGVSSYPDEV